MVFLSFRKLIGMVSMGEGEQGRSHLAYPACLCTPESVDHKRFPRMPLPKGVKQRSPPLQGHLVESLQSPFNPPPMLNPPSLQG